MKQSFQWQVSCLSRKKDKNNKKQPKKAKNIKKRPKKQKNNFFKN